MSKKRKAAASVKAVFDRLEKVLKASVFLSVFEVILTDYAEEKTMPKFFSFA